MGLFGLLGYLMRKLDFPAAALILGMVLGDGLERALRQSLMMSQGDIAILVNAADFRNFVGDRGAGLMFAGASQSALLARRCY